MRASSTTPAPAMLALSAAWSIPLESSGATSASPTTRPRCRAPTDQAARSVESEASAASESDGPGDPEPRPHEHEGGAQPDERALG